MDVITHGLNLSSIVEYLPAGVHALSGVTLQFGPTDSKQLEDVLRCIASTESEMLPWIYSKNNRATALSVDDTVTLYNRRRREYKRKGLWQTAYDIQIFFGPEHKQLLEECIASLDDRLMILLADTLDHAWGPPPEGACIN